MRCGARLRRLRGSKTKADVAKAVGVTMSSWTKYERDERTPRDDTKIRIAEYFGDTVQNIFFAPESVKNRRN